MQGNAIGHLERRSCGAFVNAVELRTTNIKLIYTDSYDRTYKVIKIESCYCRCRYIHVSTFASLEALNISRFKRLLFPKKEVLTQIL